VGWVVWGKRFLSSPYCPGQLWGPSGLCVVGTGGYFCSSKVAGA